MKIGWLCYTKKESIRNAKLIEFYGESAKTLQVELKLILKEQLYLETIGGENHFYYKEETGLIRELDKPDFAICRIMDSNFNWMLTMAGVHVFNNSFVSTVCNDKALTYQYVAGHGIPIMDTWYSKEQCQEKGFPMVVKPVDGSGGKGVLLVQNEDELKVALEETLAGRRVVFQKVASDVGKDLRVYVLGNEIVAGMLRQSTKDFRSNFTLGGSATRYTFTKEEEELVQKVISLFDFGLVGIDFIFDNGKMVFNEIEDVVGARMLYSMTDIDIADRYLAWILKRI